MSAKDNFSKVKHLYNRAGFGIAYPDLTKISNKNLDKVVEELLRAPKKDDLITLVDQTESKRQMLAQAGLYSKKDLSEEEKKMRRDIVRMQNEVSRDLNIAWISQMINTESPLREKMTLFWHGHFACRSNNPMYAQQLNNIQRTHGLGSFKTLLVEVSKSPAMLQYLNNQQNRKGKPNENFARELMELFTLGRGNYAENDIKESARAFTGWMYDRDGSFIFRKALHDDGTKTFFGKVGNFEGENIIDIILEKPQTAEFIARKAYRFFVNDTPNEVHVKELASHFYNSKYDIAALMHKLLTADWFYSSENVGNKIKSPVEFLVGLSREFYVTYNKPQVLIQLQSSLGQYLFNPPNVAGWPGGQNWIDSSSLMLRMRIPSLVLNDGEIDFSGKADPEDEAVIALSRTNTANANNNQPKSYVNASADWPKFLATLPKGLTPLALTQFLLQPKLNDKITNMVADNKGLRSTAVEITSMPEYQLC
ncbi:DUF1800 domain-containing protein [Pedobacter sandarakinus]|uniref:DUF1800 domain-containing protein n=1 Tax=Pedobacter sandarakinus TaxID=353156 RepID=UPI002247A734|nr:DUF1800 domain-containing protein [Pedobacter sandarakinus]MCX2576298.1 DUF1800 domain-containing protein [Pedobacter sandarakinus]